MDINKRLELIKQVGEEIITEDDLKDLLQKKKSPIAYDGFEPSGNIHIAQGILRAINVNKMIDAGCRFKILIADWHAWANNKLGGNLDNIKIAGKYFMEVWKAADVDMSKVEILWASDLVKDDEYWKKVMQVARNNTVNRIVRCSQIMGRSEKDALHASQILYPCMQAADIFHLDIDIAQLGMDQRKVNVLAREIAPKLGYNKPIAVHHHMLMGLGQPPKAELSGAERGIELKMSKSKPDTAIFMTDSEEDIKRKMNKAYCPEGIVEENPIMEYCKYILFEKIKSLKIERPAKWGGNLEFSSYAELEAAFSKKELHPMDLKQAVSSEISKLIEPVRKHFEKGKAKELLEQVKSFEITR
ncbi:MAG: tyrosine--tRNA ligase [Nanoarchaeota archaeon]|nr:tyrosine--tRNA ligase [Nanoarchaeota archaeon]MBU1004370.1 tyrosine--tRNA ligase [Nanoarchaeota archaeon]MBU1946743.1 tyrosine--tRNA ligase [Nanoarchaeota archaeon]